jgi:sporulation protein YlmC with PRC-barrel domain
MLQLSKNIIGKDIMSLRTGGKVATAVEPIINPHNLKIEGWYCEDVFNKEMLVLLSQDVRDFVPQGLAVNDYDVLTHPDELIRLRAILALEFQLIGKRVVSNHKRKLGKVSDYALETSTMRVQKLYVARPVYRSLSTGQLSIDYAQIIEINDKHIVVREADIPATHHIKAAIPATN